jgi:hypothetical protein
MLRSLLVRLERLRLKGEQTVFFALDRLCRPSGRGAVCSLPPACLLAAFLIVVAGCSVPLAYRAHPDLPYKKSTIRTVGLLPPMMALYEERAGSTPVPRDDWSREAAETVFAAFIDEMTANKQPLVLIGNEDRDLVDLADLFSAVDYAVQRHEVLGRGPAEPLPGGTRPFDYSLGPAKQAMERHQVDAVWFVAGFTVLPASAAQAGNAVQATTGIPRTQTGQPASALLPARSELRAALVDMSGAVLFYGTINEGNLSRIERDSLGGAGAPKEGREPARSAENSPAGWDLRDQKTAHRFVTALFSEYRKAVAR